MSYTPTNHRKSKFPVVTAITIGILVLAALCCLCLISLAAAYLYLDNSSRQSNYIPEVPFRSLFDSNPTPMVLRPTSNPESAESEQKPGMAIVAETPSGSTLPPGSTLPLTPGAVQTPFPPEMPLPAFEIASISTETLNILSEEDIPENDPNSLAQRLEGKGEIPSTVAPPPAPFQAGDQKYFWVANSDTNENFETLATLRYITDHTYFWIEQGVPFNPNNLARLAEEFEASIYPNTRAFFGSEWTPGVDGDPRLFILYARNLGESIAGYYSSKDQYHPLAKEKSNAHEMFLLSADIVDLGEEFAYSVLAHEYQHMIHWNVDKNEESWVNEGLSELAAFLNGYGVGYHDYAFVEDPDIQLNDWPIHERGPHYGAAFLFFNYLLNRFGNGVTQTVVASPQNGMTSINQVLNELNITDPMTGLPIQADDVFADWVLATFLNAGEIEDGRYSYPNYLEAPQPGETETIETCQPRIQTRDVSQYGADYIEIDCRGEFVLKFEGSTLAPVLPVEAYSGKYYFWSNRGDEADITLTRQFDFTGITGPLTFEYKTWFDLEKDYDYLYLLASTDLGNTWEILITPSGTANDPSGNSYGWGYNGSSGNPGASGAETARWIQERIDLSRYAGQNVLLRFEYVTDAAVNGEGLVLDDLAIPEFNYFTDLESDEGGWVGEGFVRIQNILPQTYRLAVIQFGQETTIQKYSLAGDNILEIPLTLDNNTGKTVLVISGTTPFTRHKTAYQFEFKPE